MLEVDFAELSDAGAIREHNEDRIGFVLPKSTEEARTRGWLFALADGVGGQDRGEVASTVAVDTMLAGFSKATPGEPLAAVLPRLIQKANTNVFETGMTTGPGGSSMATTMVACGLRFNRATIAHVGDSRCYLVRGGSAVAITKDHTVSNEQVRMGLLSAREARSATTSRLLSRALGNEMFVSVETSEHQVFTGDVLVLCSDGFYNSLSGQDLVAVVGNGHDLQTAAGQLVDLAKQRDGTDNISVQLIRIKGVEPVGMYRGRHYPL